MFRTKLRVVNVNDAIDFSIYAGITASNTSILPGFKLVFRSDASGNTKVGLRNGVTRKRRLLRLLRRRAEPAQIAWDDFLDSPKSPVIMSTMRVCHFGESR